jgi:NTE family protein
MRSATNADLAMGCQRVVVVAPIVQGGGSFGRLRDQVRALGRTTEVEVVSPDKPALRAIGRNLLDPARRAAAARAGLEQAALVADAVARVWG